MPKRFWLARAARGTMKIEGLVGSHDTEGEAMDHRIVLQGQTHAGLSGDIFVVIDSMHLPEPYVQAA